MKGDGGIGGKSDQKTILLATRYSATNESVIIIIGGWIRPLGMSGEQDQAGHQPRGFRARVDDCCR